MGDISDDIIDGFWDDSDGYWGTYPEEYPDEGPFPFRSRHVTCAFCRKDGFYWEKLNGKWRLYKMGTTILHECKAWRKAFKLTRKEKKNINRFRNNMMKKWKEQNK